ncbi:MAG TPA: hypothetical protein VLT33_07145 [Labilithrix sp.]|nr:hypothetical protein [Labilithrix sp.]
MNDGPNATWLPNLVGGVSIWKLAVDLNEAKFFDGRLLVPETEGSESLPVTVRWDLSNLLPLDEARKLHPAEVDAAVGDFQAALARVAKVFATPDSGFDKYKAAFTVPSVEADGGTNYFYSPEKKKLYVINWGASPRSMAGRAEYVFGYEDWGKALASTGGPVGASVSALAAAAPVAAAAAADPKKDEKKDEKKEKKDDGKKRPWWMWPLFALIAIALVLLALFLLKACDEQSRTGLADGGEGGAEAAADGANDSAAAGDGADEAGRDAAGAGDAAADASGADAAGDAGADASGDAGKDGGKDAGKDGSTASDDEDDDDTDSDIEIGPDGKPVPGGKVTVTFGGAPGGQLATAKKGPHRRHFQAEATKWRISAGNDRVTRSEARGRRFDVWLAPGRTFQGVGVEWQDKSGKWHAH